MTVLMLEPAAVCTVETDEEESDIVHVACHCTNQNVAWCGLDVTGEEWVGDDSEAVPCVFCEYISDECLFVCPWGCCCSECIPIFEGDLDD